MTFWIVAALLTLAACLAVLLPAMRGRDATSVDVDHDLAVYQDQLAEIDRDVKRGVIEPAEAGEARAEIGRRILKLAGERQGRPGATQAGRIVATLAILAVPVVSWGIYAATGSPHLPAQPLQARLDANPAGQSMDELLARAETHLSANPEDGRGWDVLAPIYHRIGRYPDAVTAWRNAIRLLGSSAVREMGLGEAIVSASGGVIVAEAREAFERALELEPREPRARFLLAAALAQEGRQEEAVEAWRAMLPDLAPDSPWRGAVTQAIAQSQAQDSDLISDNDQAEMIDSMVAGLDERLRRSPQDPEGWQRLVHSYVVLGRMQEAGDALTRGLDALGRESDDGRELLAFAAERGVDSTE